MTKFNPTHIFHFGDKSPISKEQHPKGVPVMIFCREEESIGWTADGGGNIIGWTVGYGPNEFGSHVVPIN